MIRYKKIPVNIHELLPKAVEYLEKRQDVYFAYLFGGLAKGEPSPLSDVDIAVYLSEDSYFIESKLEILEKLADILHRGRSLSTEIFPFSFMESLAHNNIKVDKGIRPGSKKKALVQNWFQNYLLVGGFPEVQEVEDIYRRRILQDYLDIVILRDLVERHHITNTIPLRYMIQHILNSAAGLFSVYKFYNDLKSQGISCSKNTLHNYLGHLSESYLSFPVPIHTRSERARMVNPRKIYAIDTGLVQACSHRAGPNWGYLLENFVYLELRRQTEEIEYYKTNNGHEIDFVIKDSEGRKHLIQVSAQLTDPGTRKRELRALNEAMAETDINQAIIISLNQEEKIKTEQGHIYILPAWLWASSMESTPKAPN